MSTPILQLLLNHIPFRRVLCEKLDIYSDDIDDNLTSYDETIENKDSWFSLNVVCKDGRIFKVSTRRLPQNTKWEFMV